MTEPTIQSLLAQARERIKDYPDVPVRQSSTIRLIDALETACAALELAQRLVMLVMGEAYDVEMGDADGHVGPSDEAVKLAMEIARTAALAAIRARLLGES